MIKSCARTEILIGEQGLFNLANSSVLVAGVGGVGAILAENLCRAGIGAITLIDFDKIEITDLNRQITAMHSTINQQKTDVLANRLRDINPDIKLTNKNLFIDKKVAKNIANSNKIDFVADCIDSIMYKTILIEECLKNNKKIISSMGAGGKLDATKVKITKMDKTINCGLAREIRKKLRNNKIKMNFPVVYSDEIPIKALQHQPVVANQYSYVGRPRAVNGAISYMPNIFGLMMASYIINNILKNE